jgi:2-polyprenyl-3-methyl-5-hydroxy-6-metoxy-1,4-benzoquinol methylase
MTPCPICTNTVLHHLCVKETRTYLRCTRCGHVKLDAPASQKETQQIYAERESHHASPEKTAWDYSDIKYRYFFKKLFKRIESWAPLGRILDIGCSNGAFLKAAEKRGWEAHGVELERASYTLAKEHLNSVYNQDLLKIHFPSEHFQTVTLWQVIEHLQTFETLFREIDRIVKPGGILALSTPNIQSLAWHLLRERWHAVEPAVHFHLFSPRSLKRLMQNYAFECIRMETLDLKPLTLKTFLGGSSDEKDKKTVSVYRIAGCWGSQRFQWLLHTRALINLPLNVLSLGEDIYGYFRKIK